MADAPRDTDDEDIRASRSAWFVLLDRALDAGDYTAAAEAQRRLGELGVSVKFNRRTGTWRADSSPPRAGTGKRRISMFNGKTTAQLRAERDAREEVADEAAVLARHVMETYPDADLEVELSELDDALRIDRRKASHAALAAWLREYEAEAFDRICEVDEPLFLHAFAEAMNS